MLEEIKFEVSAKTARLIGRENIAGVNGALLELIKNAYDADASICKVLFSVPFPNVKPSFDAEIVKQNLSGEDFSSFCKYYQYDSNKSIFKTSFSFSDEEIVELQNLLFKYNKIIVLDNGTGMTKETIRNSWMRIGTNDKEIKYVSAKGRVKTGAKGIGRFAMDKLATTTQMFTKNQDDSLISWHINWNGFDENKNLSDINAIISDVEGKDFCGIISDFFGQDVYESIKHYGFETGTLIVLSPTREPWTDRLISNLNSNLRGINPFKSVDRFDVTIDNVFYKDQSFSNVELDMKAGDYDYFVTADFDGDNVLKIVLNRNELDLDCPNFVVNSTFSGQTAIFDNEKFWRRGKFGIEGYRKEDYFKPQVITLDASQAASKYLPSDICKLGKFHFEFYFMKVTSGDLEITKKVNTKRRKEILSLFSGVKIYRDNFKVRPYGDEGTAYYDWIGLGERSQKSPAAVTHKDSSWRVEPYQIVGSLSISRIENQFLVDMANREGLNPNETYHILVMLLQKVFEQFEFDRQYFLREFKLAKDELKTKADRMIRKMLEKYEKESVEKEQRHSDIKRENNGEHKEEFSEEDYGAAIKYLVDEQESDITSDDVMMLLSVSGTTTNTFAHEIGALEGRFGGFSSQLRSCLKRIVPEEKYTGPALYNPYEVVKEYENSQKVLSSWIGTLVRGVEEDSLKRRIVNIGSCISELIEGWKDLLETKFIEIAFDDRQNVIKSRFRQADMYLILNNFILNSSYFVEDTIDKRIFVDLIDEKDSFVIQMENSGKKMEDKYKNNPYKMFELRETTKYDRNGKRVGTGIGLWMLQKTVTKCGGEIFFHNLQHGTFGFSVRIPKENDL